MSILLISRHFLCLEFEASKLGVPSRSFQAKAAPSPGVRVLRTHSAARAGTKRPGMPRSPNCANHLSDALRCRLLPQAGLPSSRYKARKHTADSSRAGEALRFWIRENVE